MKIAALLIPTVLMAIVFVQGFATQPPTTEAVDEKAAYAALIRLIETHPKSEITGDLAKLVKNERVFVSFQTDLMPEEMAVERIPLDGKSVIALVVNPVFMTKQVVKDSEVDQKVKQLVLYHQYWHIADDLYGGRRILPVINTPHQAIKIAADVWQHEYSAVSAEWHLARQIKAEFLLPEIRDAVKAHGQDKGFLDGFYKKLVNGHGGQFATYMNPVWETIYKKERALRAD